MSEITTLRVQREIKPNIEDVIPFCVFKNQNQQKNVLDFALWLRENNMAPKWSGVHNVWDAKCKSKTICKILLINDSWKSVSPYNKHFWVVTPYLLYMDKYKELLMKEGLHNIIWDNFIYCTSCPSFRKSHSYDRPCSPGMKATIFGREIKGFCATRPLTWLWDPAAAVISSLKKLLELEQMAREEYKGEKRGGQWPPLEHIKQL